MERNHEGVTANRSSVSADDYTINAAAGCQGLVICIGNGLLLATIITEKSLRSRKEMRLITGLAMADFLIGTGALTLGVYRIIMLSIGSSSLRIFTAWKCVKLPPTVIIYIGGQLSFVMNFIVSVDRYLAIAKPALYRRLDDSYTHWMLGAAAFFGIVSMTGLILSTYISTAQVPSFTTMCTGRAYPSWYGIYQFGLAAILSCASVAIYGAVLIAYKNRRKNTIINGRDYQQAVIQRRLTVTLGTISACTLTFYVAPIAYLAVVRTSQPYQMALLTRISTIVNIAIYIFRQEEIRRGMWKVMTCRACSTGSRGRYTYIAARTIKESSDICEAIVRNDEPVSQSDSQLDALPNVIDVST